MKLYKTKSGYYYKEYKSGKKKRISKKEFQVLKLKQSGKKTKEGGCRGITNKSKSRHKQLLLRSIPILQKRYNSFKEDNILNKLKILKINLDNSSESLKLNNSQLLNYTKINEWFLQSHIVNALKKQHNKRVNNKRVNNLINNYFSNKPNNLNNNDLNNNNLTINHLKSLTYDYDDDGLLLLDKEFEDKDYSKDCSIPIYYLDFLIRNQKMYFRGSCHIKIINIPASKTNFMHIAVKFMESITFNNVEVIKKGEQCIITSEKFFLEKKIVIHYSSITRISKTRSLLKNLFTNNYAIFLPNNMYSKTIFSDQPSSLYIYNLMCNIDEIYTYKLHISINPYYLNEAITLLLNSEYYDKYIYKMKIMIPYWNHHYKSDDEWSEFEHFNTNRVFYEGIGYIVIYLDSEDSLIHLSDFITFWKTNFEDNKDKYRDKNYIKFNTRVSKTLYFGYGGDTSSKLNNKESCEHQETKLNRKHINLFTPLLELNNSTGQSKSKIKRYLEDTYSIYYNRNQLNNLEYWYDKNTPYLDLKEKYGILPYKYANVQNILEKTNKK